MPRALAFAIGRIGCVRPGAADRQHEGGLFGIVGVEISLAILEAHVLRPVDAERPGAVAQSPDCPIVWLRHDPEQAGLMTVERVRNSEVRGERKRRIRLFSGAYG